MNMLALDIEVGFPVVYELTGKSGVKAGLIPAGRYASALYVGPYDKMEPTYTALQKWVEGQGFETTGEAYEWYFSGPETPPQKARTEVWFPLK
jgi:effector-binding domain-containing protein